MLEQVLKNEKLISEQTLRCLFRAILEPVLENPSNTSKIVLKVKDENIFKGVIERLKFSGLDYSFDETFSVEYLLVIAEGMSSLLVWEKRGEKYVYSYNVNNEVVENFAEQLKNIELKQDEPTKWIFLSKTFEKLTDCIENPFSTETVPQEKNSEYDIKKVRYISHEIKNQLSICDLYTEIIKKYCEKNGINDNTIFKSSECIKRAVKMAGNSLLELKSADSMELSQYFVKDLIFDALNLSQVYAINKGINISFVSDCEEKIIADKNRFEAVIINLVKNACEAFDEEQEEKNIIISTQKNEDLVSISVSNNARPIENGVDVFQEGLTTKSSGSGLGLYICKKNIEELSGKLELVKSDDVSTVFRIIMSII